MAYENQEWHARHIVPNIAKGFKGLGQELASGVAALAPFAALAADPLAAFALTGLKKGIGGALGLLKGEKKEPKEIAEENLLKEEKSEFLNQLTQQQLIRIQDFFNTMPTLEYELEFKCTTCGTEDLIPLRGLQNFFS